MIIEFKEKCQKTIYNIQKDFIAKKFNKIVSKDLVEIIYDDNYNSFINVYHCTDDNGELHRFICELEDIFMTIGFYDHNDNLLYESMERRLES